MVSRFTQYKRLWNTVRYLRFRQLTYRLYYRLRKARKPKASGNLHVRIWKARWSAPDWMSASMTPEGRFLFVGVKSSFVLGEEDWNSSSHTKLWLYNLHYFDALNAVDSASRRDEHVALINRWVAGNAPLQGNGWEPYPLSLRVVNWIKWFSRMGREDAVWMHSLAVQCDFLSHRLEYHLLGNHLFENAKALVFAGIFFSGEQADAWLERGLAVLDEEVEEQFLRDGAHFELSPMYHATMLWDLCDLVNLARLSGHRSLSEYIGPWMQFIRDGMAWLTEMSHPDGKVSFFNDSCFGIAPDLAALQAYTKALGEADQPDVFSQLPRGAHLKNSGYFSVLLPDNGRAIVDVAAIGPDYLPGHGHADALSFEMSLYGQRVFVNSGICCYGESPERLFQRGTLAHNTVSVNDEDSSEVWGGFRVARRARILQAEMSCNEGGVTIRGAHDGYLRLPGRNVHRREWHFESTRLYVTDEISGGQAMATARLFLHPDVQISSVDSKSNVVHLGLSGGQKVQVVISGGELKVMQSEWYPGFSEAVKSHCLAVNFYPGVMRATIEWSQ